MQIEEIFVLVNALFFLSIIFFMILKGKVLRGLIFHFFMIFIFINIASGLLFLGMHMPNKGNDIGSIVLIVMGANFFLGVPLFIYFAYRDNKNAIKENINFILSSNKDEELIKKERNIFYPVLLIPRGAGSHTYIFTGRKWLKNMSGFSFAAIFMTNKRVFIQSLFFAMPLFDIDLKDIKEISFHESDRNLLKLKIDKSSVGAFIRSFYQVSSIKGELYLNIGKSSEEWRDLLANLIS